MNENDKIVDGVNSRYDRRKERWGRRANRNSNQSNVWTGLFILLIGVAALIKVMNPSLPDELFGWQMFLIGLGIYIGFKHNFQGPAWLILIFLGSAFLLKDAFPQLAIRQYIWPIVLIAVGALLVFRPRNRFLHCINDKKKGLSDANIAGGDPAEQMYNHSDDHLEITSIFSGSKKNVISKNFKGGDIVSIFGGTEIDLTQADMTTPAVLEITTIFGGTKLIIPANWDIKSDAVTIFGGIEDKRKMHNITELSNKRITLRGTVLFGGIEIKSY